MAMTYTTPSHPHLRTSPQSSSIYNVLFRRNSVFVPTIFLGAFAFSIGFDTATTKWWDAHNKGVSVEIGGIERGEWASACCGNLRSVAGRLILRPLPLLAPNVIADTSQKQWKDIRHKYIDEE